MSGSFEKLSGDTFFDVRLGDALEEMRRIPTGSVRAVVTSPPYNLRNTTGSFAGGIWEKAALRKGYDGHSDDMPRSDYIAWQRAVLDECMRVVEDAGVIFYNHKPRVQRGLLETPDEITAGFPVRQEIIWDRKSSITFSDTFFIPTYETIYMIAKPGFRLANRANAYKTVWQITPERNNPHPAPFPIEIPLRCVLGAGEGTILDPFSGSGTTGVACRMTGNSYIGIEQCADYAAQSVLRIANTPAGVPAEMLPPDYAKKKYDRKKT